MSATTVRMDVTAGTDTSHIQFDRSWVSNGGNSNDYEIPLASGASTSEYFAMPTQTGSYTILTRARIGSTASSWVSRGFDVVPPPDPDPAITSLSVDGKGVISATWNVSNASYMRSTNSIRIYLSGANNSTQHDMGYYNSSTRSFSSGLAGDGTALIVGATYRVWVYVYDTDGNFFGANNTVVFSRPRPVNFAWTNTKSTGGTYNLTYNEWNGFLDRINEFRAYKGLSQLSFNRTLGNGAMSGIIVPTASSFNSAINAINTMSPSTSPPATVSTGQTVTANMLNTIRNALNSIT